MVVSVVDCGRILGIQSHHNQLVLFNELLLKTYYYELTWSKKHYETAAL